MEYNRRERIFGDFFFMPIVLIFTTKDKKNLEFVLLQKSIVGRSSKCDFSIADKEMSGQHGSFECNRKGQLFYDDLNSSNGSYLNNNKIEKTQLKINDCLRLGSTTVVINAHKLSNHEKESIGFSDASKNNNDLSLPGYIDKNRS